MALRTEVLPLSERSDDDLVERFQGGDDLAVQVLLDRYRRFARAKARGYFLIGADSDDIEQEGLIGLYKAVRDYRPDRQATFRAFAELCITRQIITAIKTATRQKHQPLNQYVSISGVRGGDDAAERSVEELLEDHYIADPADTVVSNERMDVDAPVDGRDALGPRGRRAPPLRRGQDATRRSASTSAVTSSRSTTPSSASSASSRPTSTSATRLTPPTSPTSS